MKVKNRSYEAPQLEETILQWNAFFATSGNLDDVNVCPGEWDAVIE